MQLGTDVSNRREYDKLTDVDTLCNYHHQDIHIEKIVSIYREVCPDVSVKHYLGPISNGKIDYVFLSEEAGRAADMCSKAIVVDDEQFERLCLSFPDSVLSKNKHGNNIALEVPSTTPIIGKALTNKGHVSPFEWKNPNYVKCVGGVDGDGSVHLSEDTDTNSKEAQLLNELAAIMRDTNQNGDNEE